MAEPITTNIVRDPVYTATDRLEADGVVRTRLGVLSGCGLTKDWGWGLKFGWSTPTNRRVGTSLSDRGILMDNRPDAVLRFRVGPVEWRIRLVAGHIDADGHPCWGVCVFEKHLILVSAKAPPSVRLVTLVHELTHAWVHSVGPPGEGEESLCDFVGTVCAQCFLDMSEQVRALRRFMAEDPVFAE